MIAFRAIGLLCAIGVGSAANGAEPPMPGPPNASNKPLAPGPILTPGPVVTPADPWGEAMAAFASADTADAHAGGVVFVGSSSIRLWADLEKRYSSYAAVNRGFGGSTLADCVKHMDRLVLPHKPRLVVIYAGDNDLAGGRSADQVLLDFVELTSRIQERLPKTQIVFVSIKPSPARIDLLGRIRDTNTRIRNYVATKPYLRYIDVFTPMLDAQGKPRAELFGGDSLHLNQEGYALWHALISPVLPLEEQPAMVKGPEPKGLPLVVKAAASKDVVAAAPTTPAEVLPKAPASPQTLRANVQAANEPPALPSVSAPEAGAGAGAAQPDGDLSAPAGPNPADIAKAPDGPRAVPANVEPARQPPAPPPLQDADEEDGHPPH